MSEPRPGAVRHKHGDEWVVTNPHDRLYSAALFAAEEVLTDSGWVKYCCGNEVCSCGLGDCPDHDDDKQSVIYYAEEE